MKGDEESPEGYSLTIQYQNVIAILHQALKNNKKKIKGQEIENIKLKEQVNQLFDFINKKK
jgi:hypothetical protein